MAGSDESESLKISPAFLFMKGFTHFQRARLSTGISATWSWYEQSQGLVRWTFSNSSESQASAVLLRSGYYFGNAFWPVYYANPQFGTTFAEDLTPLVDKGVENNAPPLAVIRLNGNYIIAFVFTLSPGQTWEMLEGGFTGIEPTGVSVYSVVSYMTARMCIGYSPEQVSAWDEQTGTDLKGYSPNPSTLKTVSATVDGPFIQLFNDPVEKGPCQAAAPTPCVSYLKDALVDLENGKYLSFFTNLLSYVECETKL